MSREPREAASDSYRSWELAIRLKREQHIRRHAIEPRPGNEEEARWWAEGEKVTEKPA